MISHWGGYHNPVCDNCGHMLAGEKTDEAAEDAMKTDGWEKREGMDICALCQRIEREAGKLPTYMRYDLGRRAAKP